MTPNKAIKEKCLECCAGSREEVRLCNIEKCRLWYFREQEKNKPKRERTQKQIEHINKINSKRKKSIE